MNSPLPHGNSSPVISNQSGPSPVLAKVVERHLRGKWQKPLAQHSRFVWEKTLPLLLAAKKEKLELILDSGCGTGESTLNLSLIHPQAMIIGVDQSLHRLKRGRAAFKRRGVEMESLLTSSLPEQFIQKSKDGRILLLRAELGDFWQLWTQAELLAARHYLLYPNPWPLQAHLKRRWHGHPLFSLLPHIAPFTELRTNWKIYGEEFAEGWRLLGNPQPSIEKFEPKNPLSPFESKYYASQHPLWRVVSKV